MSKDAIEKIVYIVVPIWGLSIVMMMLNHLLYQVVEGYHWPVSKLPQVWPRELRRFKNKSQRFVELEAQWKKAGDQFLFKREYDDLLIELVTQFPSEERLILPTRFGNAIRAFEDYSRQVYGADSIPLWIHLNTVIPKEFQDVCEDARAQVNFLLNFLLFALIIFVLSVAMFLLSLYVPHPLNANIANSWGSRSFALFAFCAGVLGWLSYLVAIERIYEWGGLVKAAFDCYLPDLAKRLGYKLPLKYNDQREFWCAVSRRAIYHRPFKSEEWPRADDSDQGPEQHKIGSPADQENASEEKKAEADDANGEAAQNEVLISVKKARSKAARILR